MGLGFSKRWVSFHKTTRIFFEGFSSPLFLFWVLSPLWVLSPKFTLASLWVLSRRFCSFRFCFSLVLVAFSLVSPLFLWLNSTFFLILFGGFDLVRTFAATIP